MTKDQGPDNDTADETSVDPARAVELPDMGADAGKPGAEPGPDGEPEAEPEADDEPEAAASPQGIAKLLRDSAIVLASVTALLYLASHMYGTEYLSFFNVGEGFQGLGLANLAMIPLGGALLIIFFAQNVYSTLTTPRTWRFLLGIVAMLAVGSTRAIYVAAHDAEMTFSEILQLVIAMLICVSAIPAHALILGAKRSGTLPNDITFLRLRRLKSERLRDLQTLEDLIAKLPADKREEYLRENPQYADLDRERREIELIVKRALALRWKYRVTVAIVSGYIAAILAVPAAATVFAAGAASSEEWVPPAKDTPARVPVYWVGDRVVFLTTEEGTCYVSVQIAGTVQTKRKCSSLVTAIKP